MLILKFSKESSSKIFLSTSSNLHFILNYNFSTRRNPIIAYSAKQCKQLTDKHHSCNHLFHFVFQIFLHVFLSSSFVFHLHFICLHQKRTLHRWKLFLFHLCNVPFCFLLLFTLHLMFAVMKTLFSCDRYPMKFDRKWSVIIFIFITLGGKCHIFL